MNTREQFKNATQYKRWLDYVEFFNKIIEIQKTSTVFYSDEDRQEKLGPMAFELDADGEWMIIEQVGKNSKCLWVGGSHDYDKRNGYYTFIHIDYSLKQLIQKYKFKYYSNEVYIT